jgi:SAM-dependent methyltransferase
MDAGHLAFRDGCFNRILAFDVLEHIPRPDQVIAEFGRVLSPRGQALLIYPWEPIRGITAIRDALQAYVSVWKARKLHIHKLSPDKIKELVKGSYMKLVGWKFFLGPFPAFATVLRKAREGDRSRAGQHSMTNKRMVERNGREQ